MHTWYHSSLSQRSVAIIRPKAISHMMKLKRSTGYTSYKKSQLPYCIAHGLFGSGNEIGWLPDCRFGTDIF